MMTQIPPVQNALAQRVQQFQPMPGVPAVPAMGAGQVQPGALRPIMGMQPQPMPVQPGMLPQNNLRARLGMMPAM